MTELNKKIGILIDSSFDLSNDVIEELKVHILRMPVIINGKEYIEGETISTKEVVDIMKKGVLIKTASPTVGSIINTYDELLKIYDEILFFTISSKFSITFQQANMISEDYNGRVFVIDTHGASAISKYLVIMAKEMIEKGYSAFQIKSIFDKEPLEFANIIPSGFKFLKNSGRISPAVYAIANMLNIYAILKLDNGFIDLSKKVRTRKKAISIMIEDLLDVENIYDYYYTVLYTDEEDGREVYNAIKEKVDIDLDFAPFGTMVLSHTGPGVVGIGRVKKIKYED